MFKIQTMKKQFFIIISAMVLFAGGCAKLDLLPKDQFVEASTFIDNAGFQAFSWQFYNAFVGYAEDMLNYDNNSDLQLNANPNGQSVWAFQLVTIPSSDRNYSDAYARLRAIHMMMDNIDGAQSKLNDNQKRHWRAVCSFFRAYNYAGLLNRYGAVPLILKKITDEDNDALTKPRTDRDSVAAQIVADLQYAEANIDAASDGANTINANVVRALMSRFGLREGTWRRYHGLSDAAKYLQVCTDASAKLMTAFPALQSSYDLDFNSNSLAGAAGILLYKQYEANQMVHVLSSRARQSAGRWDLTKKAADMYLMTDGQTRFTSPLFQGDKSPYTEFRSRDLRMYYTVPPPFKVTVSGQNWSPTGVPADAEYFSVMNGISDGTHKTLPTANWAGIPVAQEPHYADYANGQAFCVTYTGYRLYKYSNKIINGVQNQDVSDCPLFRMGEVLINYAEAVYELGTINQTVINNTVNKLRARGNVAALDINAIPADPTRDTDVPALLWEIRRERAIELMGESFRFDDLRRWGKLNYIAQRKLGRWLKKGTDVPANTPIPIENGATEGYIAYETTPPSPTIPDYYYLFPIPSDQLVLNPNIVQNPGWK